MSGSTPEQGNARLRPASTLFGAPVADVEDLRAGVVAAIGVYCDHFCEGHPGGRFAARQLRYTSAAAAGDGPQSVVDLGDFNVFPLEPTKTLDVLSTQSQRIVAAGAKLFALGGDYSVSPAIVKGIVDEVGAHRLAIIRISRRLDLLPLAANPVHEPQRRSATNKLSGLLGGGLSAVALLGGRGVVTAQEWQCASTAIVVSARELVSAPVQAVRTLRRALERVADRFYLSVDVDVLAPRFGSVALPNTQGGLSLAQLLGIVEQLNDMPLWAPS
ncbi:MAG: arginase family enzyme [Gammaproteobacteria bacterium]|jgi:arginase family enzyme